MKEQASISSGDAVSPAFDALGLPARVLANLTRLGFERPTPIQARAIPLLLEGRDIIGQARTGTGKTAAFGLPLIARLAGKRAAPGAPRALVLTPTRELALQVTEALRSYAEGTALGFVTVYGGAAYGPQLRALREGADVVIGTPGRIIDLMERESLKLGDVQFAVLDEADEMLEMGFSEAVETILAKTPEATRQVALFSATMPGPIKKVAERYLKTPAHIGEASQTVVAIEQRFVQVPSRFKREALLRILRAEERDATLVFASTRLACAEAAEMLSADGIPAEALHGDLSQPARERVVELLRQRRVDVVVATDIAARGLDIEHLTHIVNLDLPKNVEVYTHRIGRTGRAGRSGKAITLVTPKDASRFTAALERRGMRIEELFIASEHALGERQRKKLATEVKAVAADEAKAAGLADAKRWVGELVAEGMALEDVAASVLTLLGAEKELRLGATLDKGLPPWARQPQAPGPAPVRPQARPHERTRPPERARADERPRADERTRTDERPRADERTRPHERTRPPSRADERQPSRADERPRRTQERMPEPPRPPEGFVVVGVGRRHGARPADLVGALTNELGLTGRDIGRVDIGDIDSIVGVPAAFVARLGNDAWPLNVRRVETTVRRHRARQRTPYQ